MNNSKWRNRLKTVLSVSVVENKKTEKSIEKELTITAKSQNKGVLSAFVSNNLALVPEFSENVFDYTNQTGAKIINYLRGLDFPVKFHLPNQKAYESEIALYEGIGQRERGEISSEYLNKIVKNYISEHTKEPTAPDEWTGNDVPLYYITIWLNGEILEAYTCNIIQSHIISAYWLGTNPEADFSLISL